MSMDSSLSQRNTGINFDSEIHKKCGRVNFNATVQSRTFEIINCCWCFITSYCKKFKPLLLCAYVCSGQIYILDGMRMTYAIHMPSRIEQTNIGICTFIWVFQFYCMSFLYFIYSFVSFTLCGVALIWLALRHAMHPPKTTLLGQTAKARIHIFMCSSLSVSIERRTTPHTYEHIHRRLCSLV